MSDDGTALLRQFCSLLTGKHSNQQQAFDNPPFFAHIILNYRALPQFSSPTLLLEQGYAVDPDTPYRVRVLQAAVCGTGAIRVTNHKLIEPQRFKKASQQRSTRDLIQQADLVPLDGCAYNVQRSGPTSFTGTTEPGCRCIIHRNGVKTYLASSFELHAEGMVTLDRGHDPVTHERIWGSIAGEFKFLKTEDWSGEIPHHWWQQQPSVS